jgi:hypothetical protein
MHRLTYQDEITFEEKVAEFDSDQYHMMVNLKNMFDKDDDCKVLSSKLAVGNEGESLTFLFDCAGNRYRLSMEQIDKD